jgi:DNA mismatch repair ATPase MutS
MKAFLMHRDRDFDLNPELPPNHEALTQDLELNTLFNAMAAGDQYLFDVARLALMTSLTDPQAITYRQHVLADCLEHRAAVREIYDIAVATIQRERKEYWGLFKASPETILHRSVRVLEIFVTMLKALRQIADENAASFRSEGFTRFFAMVAKELDDEYFQEVEDHLKELRFRRGTLISANLGKGNKAVRHVLRKTPEQSWIQRIAPGARSSYSFVIPERDDAGLRALGNLRDKGVNLIADALAQSNDHILSFFTMVRAELAFYIGCLNLRESLDGKDEPVCVPDPVTPRPHPDGPELSADGLYDVCLTLNLPGRTVGNEMNADGRQLVVITGANQGGKSTFLRSLGLAQLMTQCGMFVAAHSFRASVCDGVFTHYKREEDVTMESGKLDEELRRMSEIADAIRPGAILLCNESFASTNEREGSEIARQIVHALLESGVRVFFVTHLFDLARGFHREERGSYLFLRAERRNDGHRTFRVLPGEPLPTSYGPDLPRNRGSRTPQPGGMRTGLNRRPRLTG